jgi:5-methylcytosine-specific restriction protein A
MELVQTVADIEENIGQLETYLNSPGSPEDQAFARSLIGAGRCFVALRRGDHLFFGPSRFVGYRNNSRMSHQSYPDKDGKETLRSDCVAAHN